MKKIILNILFLMLIAPLAFGADSNVVDLTNDASPGTDSLVYCVDDPGGTPADRKCTLASIMPLSGWTDGGANIYQTTTTDNIGIGTSKPSALLAVGTTGQFTVGSTGISTAASFVTGSGGTSLGNGLSMSGSSGTIGLSGGLTTSYGVSAALNSLTSGGAFSGTTTSNNFTGNMLNISVTGINSGNGGNIGVGTQGSGSALIIVNQGSGNTARFDDVISDPSPFIINASGAVGIGTTTVLDGALQVLGDNVAVGTGTNSNATGAGELYVQADLEVDGTFYPNVISGYVIGTNLQAWDADLDSYAGVTPVASWLEVANDATADDQIIVYDSSSAGTLKSIGDCDDSGGNHLNYDTTTNAFSCGTSASGAGGWTDGGTNIYTSTTTDNVGIGTTTPSSGHKLDVRGTAYVSGNVGIGTLLPRGTLDLGPTGTLYAQTIAGTSGGIQSFAGNVGIGTITAGTALLEVGTTGQFKVTSAGNVSTTGTITPAAGFGGRSITVNGTAVDADAELYTRTFCFNYPASPVDTDDNKSIWINDSANTFTVTKLWCESDQTVTTMLQVDDGSAADMDSADLVCITTPDTDTSLDGDATIAAGDRVDVATTSVSGTPTWATVCFTGTYDD